FLRGELRAMLMDADPGEVDVPFRIDDAPGGECERILLAFHAHLLGRESEPTVVGDGDEESMDDVEGDVHVAALDREADLVRGTSETCIHRDRIAERRPELGGPPDYGVL